MIDHEFERYPIQTLAATAEHFHINPSTLSRAYHSELLGDAAYLSGRETVLIITTHPRFLQWLSSYMQQPRVKGVQRAMNKYTVKGRRGSNYDIAGTSLVEAIANNFSIIARDANIGNAAGYQLVQVTLQWGVGILGGKGGAELLILWKGEETALGPAPEQVETSTVWIFAREEDLPEICQSPIRQPYSFPISNRKEAKDPLYRLSRSTFMVMIVLPLLIKAGLSGEELSTEQVVRKALVHCQEKCPHFMPVEQDIDLLVQAADKNIAEYFVGKFTTPSRNAVVRRRTERDDLPVEKRPVLYSRDVLWGDVLRADGRRVEVSWYDGTQTWELFWNLSSRALSESTDIDTNALVL